MGANQSRGSRSHFPDTSVFRFSKRHICDEHQLKKEEKILNRTHAQGRGWQNMTKYPTSFPVGTTRVVRFEAYLPDNDESKTVAKIRSIIFLMKFALQV